MTTLTQYIHGTYTEKTEDECFTTFNPANAEPICDVQYASSERLEQAIASAREGQTIWAAMTGAERGHILARAAELLRESNDELAALEVKDTGKPLQEALVVDILSGAEVIEYYSGLAGKIQGDYQQLSEMNFYYTRREPLGICAGIGAWNYPIQIACWKSAPALAAGNAMIFKPSEETPLTAVKLAEIYTKAGVPKGVFNVVQGDAGVGQMLTAHPEIAKVSFTGESGTGKKVMAASAQTLKTVTMELGGKSPLIIFEDSNIEQAVSGAMLANFYTQGEVCTHGTRVYVHEDIYDAFCVQLKQRTEALIVGDPMDEATQIGALISLEHSKKVMSYIESAKQSTATLLCGGNELTPAGCEKGAFVAPTVFIDCDENMSHVCDEIFGPVMSVLKFSDESEVITRANTTRYGLAAGVFTRDIGRAHRVINALQAGICWINTWGASPAEMPVGGYKESGIGRENGIESLYQYTQTKSVYVELGALDSPY